MIDTGEEESRVDEFRYQIAVELSRLLCGVSLKNLIRCKISEKFLSIQAMTVEDVEDPSSLSALSHALLNRSGNTPLAVRFRALFALKALASEGSTEAVEIIAEGSLLIVDRVLQAGFHDESELLKHELAYVLGQTKNVHAIPFLQNVLQDPKQQEIVRHEAAEALGALGQSSSLDLLEKYLHDDSQVVRETCELAVARIKWQNSQASKEEVLQQRYATYRFMLISVPIHQSTQLLLFPCNKTNLPN